LPFPTGLGSSLRAFPGLPSWVLTFRQFAAGRDSCRSILATNSNRAGIVLRIMNREGRQENPEREEKHGSAFPLETVFSFAIDSDGFGYF